MGLWFGDSGDRDGACFVNFPEIQPKDSFTFMETSMEPPKRLFLSRVERTKVLQLDSLVKFSPRES